jgi:hypothetical protein
MTLALSGLMALSSLAMAARQPKQVPEELKPYIAKVQADQLAIRDASRAHDKTAMAAAKKQMKIDVKALQAKQRQVGSRVK